MKTLSMALRNLLRNRRRSLTTLLAMIIGLITILVFGGYRGNTLYSMQTGYVQLHGHLQIQHEDYFLYGSGNPAAYGISDYQTIIDAIKNDAELAAMVTVVTPKLQLGGIAGNFAAGVSHNVFGSGIVVEEQNQMRSWDDYDSAAYNPKFDLAGTPQNSVLIGNGVARMLQLCAPLKVRDCPQPKITTHASSVSNSTSNEHDAPSDINALSDLERHAETKKATTSIEMLAASLHGAPNVAGLNVVKAVNWGFKEYDDTVVVMHLAQAQKLLFAGEKPQVTAIQIQLKHTAQMPAATKRLAHLLNTTFKARPLRVITFQELAPAYQQTIEFFDSMFSFIATLVGVIVLFTVGNTMSMAVVERTTEIGTLRAIGQRRGGVRQLFVIEGALLGFTGAFLGVLCAVLVSYLVNHSGLSWTPPNYVYPYPVKVRIWGDFPLIICSVIGIMLVAILSAWWPARRASKMLIVDALRHV
ncbi:ABC transporter permease [Undibacterium sp. Di24W]|uniref:ABC transporter permease n=1 Tax=Undibacterium sp. Di24W TaxID=3413033 RepID=UPI003BEF7CA1